MNIAIMLYLGGQRVIFSKVVLGFRNSADMCAGKFLLMSIGGRAESLACADPGARAPLA